MARPMTPDEERDAQSASDHDEGRVPGLGRDRDAQRLRAERKKQQRHLDADAQHAEPEGRRPASGGIHDWIVAKDPDKEQDGTTKQQS